MEEGHDVPPIRLGGLEPGVGAQPTDSGAQPMDEEADDSSSEEERLELPQRGKRVEEKLSISGSPPKLINTPPAGLPSSKPSTLLRRARSASIIASEVRREAGEQRKGSKLWKTEQQLALHALEDGRHVGGLSCPKGTIFKHFESEGPRDDRIKKIERSRSLPDFMEVDMVEFKKSQKSSGNSSPRSAMRDWDEDSPNGISLMLPSPREELRNYIVAHQVADCKAGAMMMDGRVMAQAQYVERDRKRPSTDPGSRRGEKDSSARGSDDEAGDGVATEIARAFKEWVQF